MRVALDLRNLHQAALNSPYGGFGGPGVYSLQLAKHLLQDQRAGEVEWELIVFPDKGAEKIAEMVQGRTAHPRVRTRLHPVGLRDLSRKLIHSRYARIAALADAAALSIECRRARFDIYHCIDGTTGPWHGGRTKFVCTTNPANALATDSCRIGGDELTRRLRRARLFHETRYSPPATSSCQRSSTHL